MRSTQPSKQLAPKTRPFALWTMAGPRDLHRDCQRSLKPDGTVLWQLDAENRACADHVEMSGRRVSAILSYGRTRGGRLRLMKHLVWPGLRTLPDVTQSSFSYNFTKPAVELEVNSQTLREIVQSASIRGTLCLKSSAQPGLTLTRTFYPASSVPALLEEVHIVNRSPKEVCLRAYASTQGGTLAKRRCKDGPFWVASGGAGTAESFSTAAPGFVQNIRLAPGESTVHFGVYYALRKDEELSFCIADEIATRKAFIEQMFHGLRLETPLKELNAQFAHCVLRGSESIFDTPNGPMHGPGGGNYYAALWTNDQCEYANPFFPFSGYRPGLEQAQNCYRLFERHMDQRDIPMRERPPLVSSITCGGSDVWHGAGDRGDASMYAYGLGRYLLEMGDEQLLKDFFPAFDWAVSFALSRKNAYGVIDSDSDELEGRFPSGGCNLFTSCTTYDALYSGCVLARTLGDNQRAALWEAERTALGRAVEHYFGDRVEGFETYRYYDGNDTLRAWICMPLTVGLFDRAEETVRALFSSRLYIHGMLKTDSRHRTTWDRSLLFALRGAFLAGQAEQAMDALEDYCRHRLLGSHAPYAFEAWPEGNRAHLAAENLLFARAVTEGLCGLQVTGWKKLRIAPKLTSRCPQITMEGLRLFGLRFSMTADENGIAIGFSDGQVLRTSKPQIILDAQTLTFQEE